MAAQPRTRSTPAAGESATLLSGRNPKVAKGDGDVPVQTYIAAMPGWKRGVGQLLDRVIVQAVPEVRKAVKWNSPFYGSPSGWFLSFHCYSTYIKVAFFNGALLRPKPPGESKQAKVRYLDIYEGAELDQEQLSAWVVQASKLAGWEMMSSNPSIERTPSSRLRRLAIAAHVER